MEDGLIFNEIDVPQVLSYDCMSSTASARFSATQPLAKIQSHVSSRKSPKTNRRRKQDTYQ